MVACRIRMSAERAEWASRVSASDLVIRNNYHFSYHIQISHMTNFTAAVSPGINFAESAISSQPDSESGIV